MSCEDSYDKVAFGSILSQLCRQPDQSLKLINILLSNKSLVNIVYSVAFWAEISKQRLTLLYLYLFLTPIVAK